MGRIKFEEMVRKELNFDSNIFNEDIYAQLLIDIVVKSVPVGQEELYYDIIVQFNKDAGGTISRYGLTEKDFMEYSGMQGVIGNVERYVKILHAEDGKTKQNKLTYVSYLGDLAVLSAKVIIEKGKIEA